MNSYIQTVFRVIVILAISMTSLAQDVRIEIPIYNIIHGVEFNTTRTVLNTGMHDKWRPQNSEPTMWSLNSEFRTDAGATLPTSVLHWQLDNIGGQRPPYHHQDILPPFQWFTTSPQYWYEPKSRGGASYTPGNVVFKFKIPASAFIGNSFEGGEYSITVTHNYGSGTYGETFTPDSFKVILVIPSTVPIEWVSSNTSVYHEVTTLNSYRTSGDEVISIGLTEISNSVPFNFWAKTASSSIQFTSSKGVDATRSSSLIKLGSGHPKIITAPLSANWHNYSANSPFIVELGNRNTFALNLVISKVDFRNHFFEAGTYRIPLEFDLRSPDNNSNAAQNTDVIMKINPMAEISMEHSNREITFEFSTAEQYRFGQSRTIPNQLMLSNNENYELYVKADAPFFRISGIQSDVTSNILQVGLREGPSISLSTTPQKIIENGSPILNRELDINYTINASAAQSLVSKEKDTYSINVIYSFTAL